MPKKPKTNQPQTPNEVQGRDFFQTPNYAVDLLVPYIPKHVKRIWECAAGKRKITNRLIYHCYDTYSTDLQDNVPVNFLTWDLKDQYTWCDAIITNPPFSLKYKFIYRALEYNVPFAFLIPFDMCQKMWDLIFVRGCQGIVPKQRIDYITPTGLDGSTGHTSYYHSFWLTYKFSLQDMLVPVELTKEMKENI